MTRSILSLSVPRNDVVVDMEDKITTMELKAGDRSERSYSKRYNRDDTLSTTDMPSLGDSTNSMSTHAQVQFDLDSTQIIQVDAISDLPDYIRRATWHDRTSYGIIMGANNLTAKLMRIGREDPESYGHCYRGLEHRMSGAQRERDHALHVASTAVLQEQKRQRQENMNNPERIASICQKCACSSVQFALSQAQTDEQNAKAHQKEYACQTPPNRNFSTSSGAATNAAEGEGEIECKITGLDDDDVSVLSDEDCAANFARFASEGKGLLKRFKALMQKRRSSNERASKRRSSNESRASSGRSSTSGSSRGQW